MLPSTRRAPAARPHRLLLVGNAWCMTWRSVLMIDATSIRALQIFQEDSHPSKMGIGKAKEGFSIYGLMQRCVTNMVCSQPAELC